MKSVTMRAPAKLNLTLEVGAKRDDGYHPITSVMSHISLYDEISVTKSEALEFETNASYLRNDDKNLCVVAAKRYLEYKGIKDESVKITLKKLIPSNSGMGGGSADAATVIKLMERLYGALDDEKRGALALSLGSDVPFCMTETSALCQGTGEIITPIMPSPKRLYVVVAKNALKLSTAKVYSDFDTYQTAFTGSHTDVIKALESGNFPLLKNGMCNVFESNIFAECPEVASLREKLLELGAFAARMTGAGPTVFGMFEKRYLAERALRSLREDRILSYFAYIL